MQIAETVATRSNCLSPKKGAVIVQEKRIISTGYNGTPRGTKNCDEGGCERCLAVNQNEKTRSQSGTGLDYCVCSHAEENAIVQAALNGSRTNEATIYTSFYPCVTCAKMIINSGIKRVVAMHEYPSDLTTRLFKQAGVQLVFLKFKS